jgi:hypothetical protein
MHQRTRGPSGSKRFVDSVFVETIITGTVVTAGTIIWARRNLASIPGTYLEIESIQHNRWKVHRYRYRFVPTTGTTFAGMLIGATDSDPTSTYLDPDTNIQRLSILPGAQFQQEWRGLAWDHPGFRANEGDLWVNDLNPSSTDFTDRFSSAGNSMLAIVSTGDITVTTELGAIFLDYDVEFFDKHLSPIALTVPTTISFDAGDFFTRLSGHAAGSEGGVGIIDRVMSGLASLLNPTTFTGAVPGLLDMLRDWVPYLTNDIPVTSDGRVQGRLGASPNEQPGFRPGFYKAKFTMATLAQASEYSWDPNGGNTGLVVYRGPISIASDYGIYGGAIKVPYGGGPTGLNQGYLKYDSEENTVGTSTETANYTQSPVTGTVYSQALSLEWEFVVGQARGFLDTLLQLSSTHNAGSPPDEVWLVLSNKAESVIVDLPVTGSGTGSVRVRPRFPPSVASRFPKPVKIGFPPLPGGPKFPRRHPAGAAAAPGGPVSRAAESKSLDHPLKIEPVSPSDGFVEFITPPRPPSGPSREMSALSARASSGPSLATIRR